MSDGKELAERFSAFVAATDFTMYVVTTAVDGERSGCLVGFASQVSIDPQRFMVGLSKENHTTAIAMHASFLAVHVLPRDDMTLARLFGHETGDEIDKFARCSWTEGSGGAPGLDDAAGWFVGRVVSRLDLGDHVGHLLEPVAVSDAAPGPFVTFSQVKDLDPGHDA